MAIYGFGWMTTKEKKDSFQELMDGLSIKSDQFKAACESKKIESENKSSASRLLDLQAKNLLRDSVVAGLIAEKLKVDVSEDEIQEAIRLIEEGENVSDVDSSFGEQPI